MQAGEGLAVRLAGGWAEHEQLQEILRRNGRDVSSFQEAWRGSVSRPALVSCGRNGGWERVARGCIMGRWEMSRVVEECCRRIC